MNAILDWIENSIWVPLALIVLVALALWREYRIARRKRQ